MKKTTKLLTLATVIALSALLGGCSSSEPQAETTTPSTTTTTTPSTTPDTAVDTTSSDVTIGIIQFAPHPSLDNCTAGTVEALEAAGYTNIDIKIADGTTTQTDMMAKTMVTSGYDVIIPIATPAAMSAYSAAKDAGIPVVFSAVADPLAAGLAVELANPQTGATGTSDALNLEGQLEMIRAFLPDATTIGVLYTTSEPNSITHLEELEAIAPNYGFTIESVGITNESEVASGATALVSKGIDAVTNFTDNNVVNNLPALLNATNNAGIPVFGSEEEQVRNGCLASETLDYIALGNVTGELAVQVLQGADVLTLSVEVIADSTPVFSQTVADALSITIPESYSHAADLG
ncbi:MAG: ABC transporter substrate-binding protein [Eubacteriales bacterium]